VRNKLAASNNFQSFEEFKNLIIKTNDFNLLILSHLHLCLCNNY